MTTPSPVVEFTYALTDDLHFMLSCTLDTRTGEVKILGVRP